LYSGRFSLFFLSSLRVEDVLFFFLIGVSVITLATKRPLVEGLPAAGISGVACCSWRCTKLCGRDCMGPDYSARGYLLFALVITWIGDTVAYFVGRAMGKRPFAPHLSPKKTWEGAIASMAAATAVGWLLSTPHKRSGTDCAWARSSGQRGRTDGRFTGVGVQKKRWREGFRNDFAGARRHAGPDRCAHFDHSGCLVLLDLVLLTAHVDPGRPQAAQKGNRTS